MAFAKIIAQAKFKFSFEKYKESQTSWTIFALKLIEMILCGVCVQYHIRAVVYKEEPMPHNVLFCSAFGGFFILSLSGVLVPASGQVTPPGVDMVFCICAFIMFYTSAVVAMFYVTLDEHLKDDEVSDEEEFNHPFFQHCREHCILSLITGTLYLMHATFSADRLLTVKKGLSEQDADINEPDLSTHTGSMPVIDIADNTPITLHLFLFDWFIASYNSKCCKWVKRALRRCCMRRRRRYMTPSPVYETREKSTLRLTPHQRTDLLAQIEAERKERLRRMISTKKLHSKATKAAAHMNKRRAIATVTTSDEKILCAVCVQYHIKAVVYKEEPMPHNVLFCSAFGGFFILSLSGVLVPASGQVTPPGVDMVFCICAFIMFYTSAVVAMFYVTLDEHLKDDEVSDEEEFNHPFFQHCREHCILSLVTGTLYLMHATFSADRLLTVKKGLSEKEADMNEPDISTSTGSMPIVDIAENTPITLHLFLFDWAIALYNSKCCKWIKKTLYCRCSLRKKEKPPEIRRTSKKVVLTPHQKAALRARIEKERAEREKKATTTGR